MVAVEEVEDEVTGNVGPDFRDHKARILSKRIIQYDPYFHKMQDRVSQEANIAITWQERHYYCGLRTVMQVEESVRFWMKF